MKYKNENGWVVFENLKIPDGGGCQIQYYDNSLQRWLAASIFPSLDENVLFAKSNYQDWARGTTFEGTVMKYMMTDDNLYWNYFITFKGDNIPEKVKVRITVFEESGKDFVYSEKEVIIDSGDTVFLNNWTQWTGGEVKVFERSAEKRISKDFEGSGELSGWTVDFHREGENYLTNYGLEKNDPLYYNPQLNGQYDLYLCFKENILELKLELPGIKHLEKVRIHERIIPAYKWWKEVYIGSYNFKPDDHIGIHKTAACTINKLHQFGDLFYIKLVPSKMKEEAKKIAENAEVIFYCEPYSIAYFGELQNEQMLTALVEEYCSLNVDKIICQLGRGGSQVIYPSKVVTLARAGAVTGDDLQKSWGVAEMRNSMNILEVFPRLCREKGIKILANIGLNVCYRGTANESKFSLDNPNFHHPQFSDFLDFSIPEVREYVASMLEEIALYDIDGIAVDHTRYCYGQSLESITRFHRLVCEKIGFQRRSELEINIRIPANNPIYYQALQILLKENLIDTFSPSNQACIYPEINLDNYVKLAEKYGKKVYGCLDAWAGHETEPFLIPRPSEYEKNIEQYLQSGVYDLFFYQSEQILENVFLRQMFKKLFNTRDYRND